MKNIFKITFLVFTVFCLFYFILPVQAQILGNEELTNFGEAAGYGEAPLPQVIGNIIKIGLSLLGLIAVIIIIAGGFIWMTSGGVVDKVTKAKKIISNGLIGLLIIVFAYAIVTFVMSQLSGVTGIGVGGEGGCTPGLCCGPGLSCDIDGDCSISDPGCSLPPDAFRIRKIETAHGGFEDDYNHDVYLCSAVQPIFNHSVDDTVIQDLAQADELRIQGVTGTWQTRNNTLIFKHPDLFAENTFYEAYFPKAILDSQGRILQECLAAGGCISTGDYFIWGFHTSTTVDIIPPEITSTYPIFSPADPNYPDQGISVRPVIEVGFSESIDITTVADVNNYPIDTNIWLSKLDGQNGSVVEVLSKDLFEIIGGDNGFEIHLRNENLEPFTWYRIHIEGVEDLCLNAMAAAIEWEFQTNDQAPGVSSQYPTGDTVCPDTNITVVFNTQMYNNLVRFEITGGDSFTFDIRGSELGTPYEKIVPGGVFKITDPGDPINDHFRVFTFNPDNNLQSESDYQVTVLTDLVIDQQGTLLSDTWEFTTATMGNCVCVPWISRLEPAQGSRGECITLYGQCFQGTATQPANPTKIEFIFNEIPEQVTINGSDNNYLTTQVPSIYSQGDRPDVRATIEYDSGDQLVSNLVEFYVDSDEQASGPCLFSINPSAGYSNETEVDLSGIRFSTESARSKVVFYNNKLAVYQTWGEQQISSALVPSTAEDGLVYVENDQGTSNGLPFDVLQYPGGPGQACQSAAFCPDNPPYSCSTPIYNCRYEATDTCRCCCDVITNSCEVPLECMANQGSCTGDNRGLCCGCESDAQCGGDLGCGILDINQCCYSRPTIISNSPTGEAVCLNTAVEANFSQEMDHNSLNEDNIQLIKLPPLVESKLGRNYTTTQHTICLDQSSIYTGRCDINWWDYSFNVSTDGNYQIYVETSNYSADVKDFGEDGVCSEPGVQHHVKVFVDSVEKGDFCADATLGHQISNVSLGNITSGAHTIRLEWDNKWFESPHDSNIRIYQVDLRQEAPEENVNINLIVNQDNDQISLLPVGCNLDTETGYKVKLTGGIDGQGIRDSLGVSMSSHNWQFTTGDEDNLCEVNSVLVSPDSAIVESFEDSVVYMAQGYDFNENQVCVAEFLWESDDVSIAIVSPSQGIETTVSPVGGEGEQTTDISATVLGYFDSGEFTSVLSPPIITGLSPGSGSNNPAIPTYITITGTDFGNRQNDSYVRFGFYEAEIGCQNWSDTEIVTIIPPDLTVGQLYSVTLTRPDQGQSNGMLFGVTEEFHPAICKLEPNQGKTNTLITIQGTNFGDQQGDAYVVFGEGGADPQIIDEIEEDNWFNTEIIIIAPEVPEEVANVVVYVSSPIEAGNPLKPSNTVSFYKSPRITSISPEQGPKRTWITIKGENFGSNEGNVYFKYDDTDYLAEELPDHCLSYWTEQEIIIVVPETLPDVAVEDNFYESQVYIETTSGTQSNLVEWGVNKEAVAPALCGITPNEDLQVNDLVNIIGDRFDFGLGELDRRLIFNQDKVATSLEWTSNTEITNAVLPSGTISGDVFAEKDVEVSCHLECDGFSFAGQCFGTMIEVCTEGQIRSNPLSITLLSPGDPETFDLPQVFEDSTCSNNTQTPSPRYLSSQSCRNALISARFNMEVNNLSNINIIVEKCNPGNEEFDSESCTTNVSGTIVETDKSFVNPQHNAVHLYPDITTANRFCFEQGYTGFKATYSTVSSIDDYMRYVDGEWVEENSVERIGLILCSKGFIYTPTVLLDQDYWYQVTLKSGDTGIISSVDNYQLDGNKDGIEDGSPNDDYVWYFKTKGQAEVCSAQAIEIFEQDPVGIIIESGTKDYSALPIGPDCQILRQDTFTWTWQSTEPSVATITPQTPTYTAMATAVDLGETEIEVTATPSVGESATNFVDLVVATYPNLESFQPSYGSTNVCRNSVIRATFDQIMNRDSLSKQKINFYKWDAGWQDITSTINISIFDNEDDETEVNINAGLLDANQEYQITILGGENGVESIYGIDMAADYNSTFTTSDEICLLSEVNIEPKTIDFTVTSDSENLIAYTYDNQGNEILGIPSVYDWTWLWESSDPAVVSITGSSSENETATAQDRNGRVQITATATIVGSDPAISVLGIAEVNVFICEVPWIFEDSAGPALAPNAQFKLGYCRGDLAQDEADRLPELSGASIEGSEDLIKEFLFSVGETGDVIGLKVFNNPKRLSVLSWYKQNAPNPGTPSSFVIDNYYALREGRTTYVGATNVVSDTYSFTNPQHDSYYLYPDDATAQQYCIDDQGYGGFESYTTTTHGGALSRYNNGWGSTGGGSRIATIICADQGIYTYTYVYLISYNDGANPETIEIFNQILNNWEFNINLGSDIEGKAKIQNDLLRFYDFEEIKNKLNDYYQAQGKYPTLGGGTYILGKTNSLWPSWANTLSQALGGSLPVDPINEFNTDLNPCADCPNDPNQSDYQCQGTCYNPNTQIFEIPNGSHVYQYYAPDEAGCVGEYYTLSVNLEYGNGGIVWKGEEDVITIQADSSGDFNYFYYSLGTPVCGDGTVQCGEQCDCGGGYDACCSPFQSGYCPGTTFPSEGFIPVETCEGLGYESEPTGFLECDLCSWSGVSCAKKANGEECGSDNNCHSGYCVDGICCDDSCTGNCEYCGEGFGGSAGTCHDVSAGNDPRDVCDDTSGCLTGNCNGSGFCTDYYTSGDRNCSVCQTCDGATSGTCLNKANNTQDTTSPALCQDTCKRCYSGACVDQTTSQDLFNQCDLTWNSCDSDCVRKGGDGQCDTGGVCDTNDRTGNITSGSVCTGAGEVTSVSASNYCGSIENYCTDNSCSGTRWYRSCDGSGACRGVGDHTGAYSGTLTANSNYVFNTACGQDYHNASDNYCGSIINDCTDGTCSGYRYYRGCDGSGACKSDATGAYQQTVYPNTGKTLTSSCSPNGTTLCGFSSWNYCSTDCFKTRDELRCSAGHTCSYDVGNNGSLVAENKVCVGGSEMSVSSTYYCDIDNSCTAGACSGTRYYRACAYNGVCKTDNTGAFSETIYPNYFQSLNASCEITSLQCATCNSCDGGGNCTPVTGIGTPPYLGCGSGKCCNGTCCAQSCCDSACCAVDEACCNGSCCSVGQVCEDGSCLAACGIGGTATLDGYVYDAIMATGINGATVILKYNGNAITSTTTITNGSYTFSGLTNRTNCDEYTLEISATSYLDYNVSEFGFDGAASLSQDVFLAPVIPSGDILVVYTWDGSLNGNYLDVYLSIPSYGQISYLNQGNENLDNLPYAYLSCYHTDGTENCGDFDTSPETLQFRLNYSGTYMYYINDFAEVGNNYFNNMDSTVKIYTDAGLQATFIAPTGSDEFWYVFDIDSSTGVITTHNIIVSSAP